MDRADIEITAVSKEDGVTFKATVTVKPEVEISNYKNIAAVKKEAVVTDEDVAKEIERLRGEKCPHR